MVKLAEMVSVNSKVVLAQSVTPGAITLSCLVKKTKENLIAIIISSRDANKLELAVGDNLYILNEWNGKPFVTPVKLLQRDSYPLVITQVTGDASELTEDSEPNEPIFNGIEDPLLNIEKMNVRELATPLKTLEDPLIVSVGEDAQHGKFRSLDQDDSLDKTFDEEDIVDYKGFGDLELATEDDNAETKNNSSVDLPAAGASQNDTESDSDIAESSIDEAPGALIENSELESISYDDRFDEPVERNTDMHLASSAEVELIESSDGSGGKEEVVDQKEEKNDALSNFIESNMETGEETMVDRKMFDDFFKVSVTPIDSDTAAKLVEKIESGDSHPFQLDSKPGGLDEKLPDEMDPATKKTMMMLFDHILNIENTVLQLKRNFASPFFDLFGDDISAICVRLNRYGIRLLTERPIPDGGQCLVSIDRPWKPALCFKALARVESQKEVSGHNIAQLRFTTINQNGLDSISSYIEGGAEYLDFLKKLVSDQGDEI